MMRMPRLLPSVVVACFSVALPLGTSQLVLAQDNTAVKTEDASLQADVDVFWHDAKTFRYDLASAQLKKVLDKNADPVALLQAVEAVAADRKDNADQWLLRWQQIPELRESMDKLMGVLSKAHNLRRADQNLIEANIQRLPVSDQAYMISINRLRESGELAVPLMLDYLRNPAKKEFHTSIRRALVDLGRSGLSPLVAATHMPMTEQNQSTLLVIIGVLGEVGYDASLPPLVDLANDAKAPAVIKTAAKDALLRLGSADPASLKAANLYYELAQKYFKGKAAIAADVRNPAAFYWSWDDQKGLIKKDVPPSIFNALMALDAAKRSLQLDPTSEAATSLWLSACYGREVHLAAGATDPTRAADAPKAHYYGVAAGAKYLNLVLTRALNDNDAAIALQAIKSLQVIGGQSNLFAQGQTGPLVAAMRNTDRNVRFEAAFALAAALPQTSFEGQERVVAILSEAIAPQDDKSASEYALKATQLLGQLATSRGQVLDLSGAQNTLLKALQTDTRADVVKAAGNVLGLTNSRPAQSALLAKAMDAKTEPEVKLSVYHSLTTNAKFFGNLLENQEIADLQKVVAEEPNVDVRTAAAEAHGALNLPPEQVKAMLLK